jgi:transposase
MDYFAGVDVSLETVSVCIVNAAGDILLEKKVEAEPAAIIAVLKHFGRPLKRIGLEAGPTSSWLYSELRNVGYPAICLECRHVKAGLSAMRNKTDRNDARGIAQLVRLVPASPRQKRRGAADTHVAGQPPAASDQGPGSRKFGSRLV